MKNYDNLSIMFSENKNKVEAINSNVFEQDFDILLLASDDMIPIYRGYDLIIKRLMAKHFKDYDGVLWFNDGTQGMNLNTLVIMGRTYYDRFKYIYHPDYKSLYCDSEFTEVSKILGRVVYCPACIIEHQHHTNLRIDPDLLYSKNESYVDEDRMTYEKRKTLNFP